MPAGSKHPYLLFNTSYKIFGGSAVAAGKCSDWTERVVAGSFGTVGLVVPGTSQHTLGAGQLGESHSSKSNYGIYGFSGTFAAPPSGSGMVGPRGYPRRR